MGPLHDAAVLGGGPSGAAAATLLARWGHAVVLCTRSVPPAPALAESIPPSARKLLDAVGCLDAVQRAGFFPNGGNTVWWAGGTERSEPFPLDAPGVHAERRRWEEVLLDVARAAGVDVRVGASVRAASQEEAQWRLEAKGPFPPVRARWLLDASGRSGVVARRGHRVKDDGPATLALVARWSSRSRDAVAPEAWAHHTLVESYRDGWAWSVPLAADHRCVTAMVDPDLTELDRGGSLARTYAAELAKTSHLGACLAGWEQPGRVWACPASLYSAHTFARPGLLLVGDAGSFIDPLSSYGVKKALASAWLAAVVVHTALTDPGMTEAALELFDSREREVYRTYRTLSLPFFREAHAAYGHPYWERRAEAAERASTGGGRASSNSAAAPDPADALDFLEISPTLGLPGEAVHAAFERVRGSERLALRPGSGVRWTQRSTVEGNRVVRREHLTTPSSPAGARFFRSVDLRRLAELAPDHRDVPELWEAYNKSAAPVPLPDLLAALAVALAAGALEPAE